MIPYALSGHVHEKGNYPINYRPTVRFMPHVAAFFRGISLTIAFELDHPVSVDELGDSFSGRPTRVKKESRCQQGNPTGQYAVR